MDAYARYYPFLFPVLVVALVLYQLKIGQTIRMRFIPSISKAEHQMAFWAIIAFQVVLAGYGAYEGVTRPDPLGLLASDDSTAVNVAGMTGGGNPNIKQAATKAAPPPPTPTPLNAALRDSAIKLHRAKRYAAAIPVYDAALGAVPGDPEVVYWRGVAHWNTPNGTTKALADFRRAIELDPANWNAHLNADRILTAERKWDESVALWNKYLERVPNSGDAYWERSGTNRLKGDTAGMRADAAKACELGRRDACPAGGATKAR
jgi:hypothetical protein